MGDSEIDKIELDSEETRKKVSPTLFHMHIESRPSAAPYLIDLYIGSFNISYSFEISVMCSDVELVLGKKR